MIQLVRCQKKWLSNFNYFENLVVHIYCNKIKQVLPMWHWKGETQHQIRLFFRLLDAKEVLAIYVLENSLVYQKKTTMWIFLLFMTTCFMGSPWKLDNKLWSILTDSFICVNFRKCTYFSLIGKSCHSKAGETTSGIICI